MEVSTVSLEHTGRFNRLILDYLNQNPDLEEFYGFAHELENYPKKIEERNRFPFHRDLLADSLIAQYKSIGGATVQVLKNIESLRDSNTYTVTTGHQLNIFTGPLYFIYKILHTIKLADELNDAYPDRHFVPVYWMNSEDHDIDEVGQFNLFGTKYSWNTDQTGTTGRMKPESLTDFCDQLDEIFSNDEATMELVQLFRKSYTEFDKLSDATRNFVNELFGKRGLVIIDSDDAGFKASFVEHFLTDILKNKPFSLVKSGNLKLAKLNYHVQVNPREINCFYLADGLRNRIVRTASGFHVLHTDIRFTEDEMVEEIKQHPERFSPNVVLRPLFQEFILPNLTYVGGAGELSYWLQYKEYFTEMGVSFPILGLRNHFLLIDSNTSKKLTELKLLPEDLFHSVDDLVKEHVLELSDTEVGLDEEKEFLKSLYASLKDKAESIDPTLVQSIEAEETRMEKGLEQWQSRFTRGLKKQNEVSVNRIRSVHKKLFPNGYLQERHDNFMAFYSRNPKGFFDMVYNASAPFNTEFRIIIL
ncbi:MAG: bacillithiol biosynthesis cysteine-adding enzyme BshC [Flavobacteriales bacterium]|nr:bacillithiol biosynthesis cysteine-adding enzyme BshC [Flavobacteriales bacterium]